VVKAVIFLHFDCGLTTIRKEGSMNEPNGKTLLETLVKLLEEQENVKITYEVRDEEE
jgi:hypothetical protein